MQLECIRSCGKSNIQILNFGYVSSGHSVYFSKVVRIRGYFSKPKMVLEQKSLENTGLEHYIGKECSKNLHMSMTVKFVSYSKCQFVSAHTRHGNASSFYTLTLFRYQWSASCGVMLLLKDSGWAASLFSLIDQDFLDRLIFRNVGNYLLITANCKKNLTLCGVRF